MTNLSDLFPQSAVQSVQEGYIDVTSLSTGSGEDTRYKDITISAVDTAKCVCRFVGTMASSSANARYYNYNMAPAQHIPTAKLTSTINLRIGCSTTDAYIAGRWVVVEYK